MMFGTIKANLTYKVYGSYTELKPYHKQNIKVFCVSRVCKYDCNL